MRTVIVGSTNPVKLTAVQTGFGAMFPQERFNFRGIDVPSGVSAQPQSDAETLQGAKQRAANAREQVPGADFWVGIEGGVDVLPGNSETLLAFARVVVIVLGLLASTRNSLVVYNKNHKTQRKRVGKNEK